MARTPTDPTKAEVWITKGLDDLDFEFYFPQGPKGDAGGFTLGTALDNATDTGTGKFNLNDILVSGIYRMTATNDNLLIRNYPRNYDTGILEVFERVPGQTILQVWHSINQTARLKYERTYVTGTWSPWRLYTTTRIDQTAGRAMYMFDDVNGREQLVWGDTGVRRVETSFINGWVGAIASLRRVGSVVTMGLYGLNPSGNTAAAAYNIPSGFRPGPYGGNVGIAAQTNGSLGWVMVSGSGDLLPPTNYTSCQGFIHLMTWITGDSWPTALPGTASGSIPNI